MLAHDDRTDLLQLDNGRLVGVRRFRAGGADAEAIVDTLGPTARVGIAGDVGRRRELASALSQQGITVASPSGEWSHSAERGDLLAAQFAGSEVGPVLRSEDAAVVARTEARKATWMVAGAAAAMLVLSAAIEMWGVHRQLGIVRDERARIRPQIASTIVGRTTVDATSRHLATLNTVERSSPHWSSIITMLSQSIPDDAHLTAIRARQDSLIIDGLAEHASRVFDALQQSNMLLDVKSAAAVRREIQDDGNALDHFTIAGRVAPPKAPAPAISAPASNGPSGAKRPGQ